MKPTNEVLYNMIENLSKNFENYVKDTREYHKSHDEKQEKILNNVIKTNGRVSKLEEVTGDHTSLLSDYKERRANINGVFKFWGLISVGVVAGISYGWVLYMQNFKYEIINELAPQVSDMVYEKLEKEYYIDIK